MYICIVATKQQTNFFTMQEIISQLKYDIQQIESKLKSISGTRVKMEQWKGKPIYKGCEEAIEKWQQEIEQHKDTFFNYSNKLKNI